MVAIKFVFLLCVTLCTSMSNPSSLRTTSQKLNDVVDDLLALLQQLRDVVDYAIDSAVTTLNGLLNTVTEAVQEILSNLSSALENAAQAFITEIDHLEEKAAEAGVDVAECIGNSKEDINALPAQFLANATSCLTSKVIEAEEKINQTIVDILSFDDIITTLEDGIEACQNKSALVQPICYAAVAAEITVDLVSLPLKISADVASISSYISTFVPTLEVCEVGMVAGLTVAGAEIVADVTVCVIEKINNNTLALF